MRMTQANYHRAVGLLQKGHHDPCGPGGMRRGGKGDTIMPSEDATKTVDKLEIFAVSHCHCRHHKELLGQACRVTSEKVDA